MKIDFVKDWLRHIAEATEKELIPPFVVEIVMRDHRSYFLQDVLQWDEESGTVTLRIWDLRALSDQDREVVKLKVSNPIDKKINGEGKNLHPHLNFANLRIAIKDIMYCIEWPDRMWPVGSEAFKMYKKTFGSKRD